MLDAFDALAAFASAAALFVVNAVFVVFVLLRPRVRQPSSLAWILVIVVLPVAGIVLYLAVGEVRTGSRRKRRHRTIQTNIRAVVQKAWSATSRSTIVPWGTESIARLARLGDETQPRQGNRLALLATADSFVQSLVADIDAAARHGSQQAANGHGSVQAHGDLRVPANQRHVVNPRRLRQVVQKPRGTVRVDAFRQQQCGHQPARACARRDEVVFVDREQIAGELGAAEGDRVGGSDQEIVAAQVQHRRVFANGRAEDHVGQRGGHPAEELPEQLGWQLAGGEVHRWRITLQEDHCRKEDREHTVRPVVAWTVDSRLRGNDGSNAARRRFTADRRGR